MARALITISLLFITSFVTSFAMQEGLIIIFDCSGKELQEKETIVTELLPSCYNLCRLTSSICIDFRENSKDSLFCYDTLQQLFELYKTKPQRITQPEMLKNLNNIFCLAECAGTSEDFLKRLTFYACRQLKPEEQCDRIKNSEYNYTFKELYDSNLLIVDEIILKNNNDSRYCLNLSNHNLKSLRGIELLGPIEYGYELGNFFSNPKFNAAVFSSINSLDISNNKFSGKLNLSKLRFIRNDILKELQSINASHNKFNGMKIRRIDFNFRHFDFSFLDLNLSYNQLNHIPYFLQRSEKYKKLNACKYQGSPYLYHFIAYIRFKQLNLSHNPLSISTRRTIEDAQYPAYSWLKHFLFYEGVSLFYTLGGYYSLKYVLNKAFIVAPTCSYNTTTFQSYCNDILYYLGLIYFSSSIVPALCNAYNNYNPDLQSCIITEKDGLPGIKTLCSDLYAYSKKVLNYNGKHSLFYGLWYLAQCPGDWTGLGWSFNYKCINPDQIPLDDLGKPRYNPEDNLGFPKRARK